MSRIDLKIKNEIRNKNKSIDPINILEVIHKEVERQLMAEKLLKHVLGDAEYGEFVEKGIIKVISKKDPNRTYIIREYGLISVYEGDKEIEKLCINPAESDLPSQDQIVTKKLFLEAAEDLLLKTANHISVFNTELCERIRHFNIENLFSDKALDDIKSSTDLNLGFNIFLDNGEELLKKVEASKQFNLEGLFEK